MTSRREPRLADTAEIAAEQGLTPARISQFSTERTQNTAGTAFPEPVGKRGRARLWDHAEVTEWFAHRAPGDAVVVTARTRDVAVACPVRQTPTAKVHGYHRRTVTDVPVDGRPVVDHLRARRLVCPVLGCRRQTFRKQIPGLLSRHQRRAVRLALADFPGGAGVVRPCGRTPRGSAGRARFPQYRAASSAAPAAAAAGRPAGDRCGRFRPASAPPLRHDHHGCRDRPTPRGPARPREGHPRVLAARTSWCRGRVPGRLGHPRRGHPPRPAPRGAGQRPMAPLAQPLRQNPARGPRARRLLGQGAGPATSFDNRDDVALEMWAPRAVGGQAASRNRRRKSSRPRSGAPTSAVNGDRGPGPCTNWAWFFSF